MWPRPMSTSAPMRRRTWRLDNRLASGSPHRSSAVTSAVTATEPPEPRVKRIGHLALPPALRGLKDGDGPRRFPRIETQEKRSVLASCEEGLRRQVGSE